MYYRWYRLHAVGDGRDYTCSFDWACCGVFCRMQLSRLRNDLYCVGWGVKLYSLTHCRMQVGHRHLRSMMIIWTESEDLPSSTQTSLQPKHTYTQVSVTSSHFVALWRHDSYVLGGEKQHFHSSVFTTAGNYETTTLIHHGLYCSTSCCISHGSSQWERAIFDPPQLGDPSTDFHVTWNI